MFIHVETHGEARTRRATSTARRRPRAARLLAAAAATAALYLAPVEAAHAAEGETYDAWASSYERWDSVSKGLGSTPALRLSPSPIGQNAIPGLQAPQVFGSRTRRPVSILPASPPEGNGHLQIRCLSSLLGEPYASLERPDCAFVIPTPRGPDLHRELWFVTIELFAVQSASIAIFAALPEEVSGFTTPSSANITKFARLGPHFDDDRWGFNYVGHPLAGSEYYLLARNRRATWWQAFLYSAAWSAFWEYVTEGLYERASIQDLIVTPVAGSVLGELRYQLRRELLDMHAGAVPSWPLRVLVIALDPVEALSRALPLRP